MFVVWTCEEAVLGLGWDYKLSKFDSANFWLRECKYWKKYELLRRSDDLTRYMDVWDSSEIPVSINGKCCNNFKKKSFLYLRHREWVRKLYPNNADFEQAAMTFYTLFSGTKFLSKFSSGFLLKDILDRFTSKTQNTLTPNRKLWMYSTHDLTLFNFLRSLDISDVRTVFEFPFFSNLSQTFLSNRTSTFRILRL